MEKLTLITLNSKPFWSRPSLSLSFGPARVESLQITMGATRAQVAEALRSLAKRLDD